MILEAQGFNGYKKRKNLTPRIRQNFENIGLRPENFYDYLLYEVSFTVGETIAIPTHASQGFQRPLQVNTYVLGLMRIHEKENAKLIILPSGIHEIATNEQ